MGRGVEPSPKSIRMGGMKKFDRKWGDKRMGGLIEVGTGLSKDFIKFVTNCLVS